LARLETLRGKTALVTGGAKRLGAAIEGALADAGVHVAIHCHRSAPAAWALADSLRKSGVNAWVFQADLAQPGTLGAFFETVTSTSGPIDILVNNASIFHEDGLRDFTTTAYEENLRINALAPALLARSFAEQGRPGCVINMLDTMVRDYDRKHAAYHLSKRTLDTLTRMMAVEFAPDIRVNAVAPGLVLPPEGAPEGYLEKLAHTNPLQRHGDEGDVADAVLFLLRSPFVTGQTIYVDGGRHLRGSMYE
jgi:NAD(P)-dependent dehydrogenase (short-subunit alcohol dehydrogenase family)